MYNHREKAIRALTKVPYPVLECVVKLLERENGWTQEEEKVFNDNVEGINPYSYCLIGAIQECDPDWSTDTANKIDYRYDYIVNYNDDYGTNQKKVVRAVKRAMEIQEKKLAKKG